MPNADDIKWFKQTFGSALAAASAGTAFDADQLISIACQETGYIWSTLRKKGLTTEQVAALCVGDTIDYKGPGKGRQAFPKNKAALVGEPHGSEMFDIARAALVGMAKYIGGYGSAVSNPNKFCHGYGVFQRDLQFFKVDPNYFLQKRYESFAHSLDHCIEELKRGCRKLGFSETSPLSDENFYKVAIAYNTGGYKPSKGLKQGYFDGTKYYGEWIAYYVELSRTVKGEAPLMPGRYVVIARGGLKLRTGPGTDFDWDQILPVGTPLSVVRVNDPDPAWVFVDLEADGAIDGCVFGAFLEPVAGPSEEGAVEPG